MERFRALSNHILNIIYCLSFSLGTISFGLRRFSVAKFASILSVYIDYQYIMNDFHETYNTPGIKIVSWRVVFGYPKVAKAKSYLPRCNKIYIIHFIRSGAVI